MAKDNEEQRPVGPRFLIEATYEKGEALRIAKGEETERDRNANSFLINPDAGIVVINNNSRLRGCGVTEIFMARDKHLYVPLEQETLREVFAAHGYEVYSYDKMKEIRNKGPQR